MNKQNEIRNIVVIYALCGSAWILFSDIILSLFVNAPDILTIFEILKGLTFVTCTSILLYFLIARLSIKIHKSANALRDSEEKFQIAFNNAPIGILLTDSQGRVINCNKYFATIFGAQQENYIGMNLLATIPQGAVRQNLADAIADGEMHRYEGPYSSVVTGKKLELSISTEQATPDIFITLILDITERKKIENELRESEDKFRLTFNFSPDAVNINRLEDGLYVDINEGFSQYTGYSRDDVIGKTSSDIKIWHNPQDRQRLVQGLQENGLFENLEAKFRKKDGSFITGLMSARVISFKGVPHIVSITRDITEREFREKEQLKIEKLESLAILAGGIAHDFNNILTGIMGNISFAKIFLDIDHKSFKPLSEAEKATVRAGELAHQLLTFARGGEPIKKDVSIQHIINEAVALMLHGSNVMATVDIPDSIHAIKADAGQINQVCNNIIINAMHAMPGGGGVAISARNEVITDNNILPLSPGEYVRLTFSDEGCGISEDNLQKIFDPYFTTKPTGNGLGLASAYSIINRHRGHISVNSVVGKGTSFTIYLPSKGEIFIEDQPSNVAQKNVGREGGAILVMDDDPIIRDVATTILTHLGYEVTTCASGEEAIQLYKNSMDSGSPFLTVIMDLTIPGGLGGKETAEQILKDFPNACLIVSSGYSNDSIMSNYHMFGFGGAIAKPYNIREVKKVLDSLPVI